MSHPRFIGRDAEDRAAAYLLERNVTIITRRFKTAHGELDLVALDGDELVFVEVKARFDGAVPEESLTPRKMERLRRAAQEYLVMIGEPERSYRFDLIALDASSIRHYRAVG